MITLGRLPKGLELARALAGAGCRVLVAEPWRWHLTREDSLWYSSARLFRQSDDAPGNWTSVLNRVASELNRLIEGGSLEA